MAGHRMLLNEKIALIEAYHREPSNAEIARLFKRSDNTIGWQLRHMGIAGRRVFRVNWRTREIRALVDAYRAGKTYPELAEMFGRSATAVKQFVHANRKSLGLPKRNMGRVLPGQKLLIGREAELMLTRVTAGTGRTRGTCVRLAITYLLGEGHRNRKGQIIDLGGMVMLAPPGPKRKPLNFAPKRKKAA